MMLGWHFLATDRTLRTGERVQVGGRYTTTGPLVLCRNGLHASRRVLDALIYAPSPIVCRVRLLGEILLGTDKAVARTRQVLWMADATLVLHDFALSVATNALELTDTTDWCCWAVLDVKRRWLRGQVTDQELDAAKDAADDAAEDADRATWAVVGAATWADARDAALEATWAATRAVTRADARAATRDAYNFQLETMLESLRS